jgi:predicted hydrolase (HD superfamily)
MELAEARALVREKTNKDITVGHLISVEGVMRALARRLGQDEHRWALAGLFHDLDQDQTRTRPARTRSGTRSWRRSGCARPGWRSRWSTRCWPTPTSGTAPT